MTHVWREGEKERVHNIKKRLEKEGIKVDWSIHNDHTIKRFLRARNQDEQLAYESFTKCLEWRKENHVDTIIETAREINPYYDLLKAYWPGELHGYDKEGDPLYVERLGDVDPKGVISLIPPQMLVHYNIVRQEERRILFKKESERQGREVEQFTIIQDMSGLGLKHAYPPAVDVCKQVMSMTDAYYPECLKRYYVINPPKMLPVLYKILSPFADPVTLAKVIIAPKSGELPEDLLQHIDANMVPVCSGGACTRCEGGCLPEGGVLKDHLKRKNGTTFIPISTDISRKSKLKLDIKATEGEVLRWEFESKKPGGLRVVLKDESGSIVACSDSTTGSNKVLGAAEITKTGVYELLCQNTGSRKHSVTYTVTLTTSTGEPVLDNPKGDSSLNPLPLPVPIATSVC